MTYTLTYYMAGGNFRGHKILSVAALAGVEVEQKMVVIPAPEEYKKMSPLGANPFLETPEGPLFESNAIMRHIARMDKNNNNFFGKTPLELSTVEAWCDLCITEVDPLIGHIYKDVLYNVTLPASWLEDTEAVLTPIENWLAGKKFLVGDAMTLADICLSFSLQLFFRMSPHREYLFNKYANIVAVYSAVMGNEKIAAFLETVGGGSGLIPLSVKITSF